MADAKTRKRLIDLSVIATSALVLGGGFLVVAAVDEARTHSASSATALAAPRAPVSGLDPAPAPARKVVVVRRSRPS